MPKKYDTLMGLLGKGLSEGGETARIGIKADEDRRTANESLDRGIEKMKALRADLQKQGGKGSKYNIGLSPGGGVSVQESDMDNLAQQIAMDTRKDAYKRAESESLAKNVDRLGGKDLTKKVQALNSIEEILNNPTGLDHRRLATQLRNLVEVGVATERDVEGQLPTTWRTLVNKAANFFGEPGAVDPVSKEQLGAIKQYVEGQKRAMARTQEAVKNEVSGRSKQIAPTLHKSGELPQVLESLGVGVGQQLGGPGGDPLERIIPRRTASPPTSSGGSLSPDEQAELETLRKRFGKR